MKNLHVILRCLEVTYPGERVEARQGIFYFLIPRCIFFINSRVKCCIVVWQQKRNASSCNFTLDIREASSQRVNIWGTVSNARWVWPEKKYRTFTVNALSVRRRRRRRLRESLNVVKQFGGHVMSCHTRPSDKHAANSLKTLIDLL